MLQVEWELAPRGCCTPGFARHLAGNRARYGAAGAQTGACRRPGAATFQGHKGCFHGCPGHWQQGSPEARGPRAPASHAIQLSARGRPARVVIVQQAVQLQPPAHLGRPTTGALSPLGQVGGTAQEPPDSAQALGLERAPPAPRPPCGPTEPLRVSHRAAGRPAQCQPRLRTPGLQGVQGGLAWEGASA